jgi:hypothetical protein
VPPQPVSLLLLRRIVILTVTVTAASVLHHVQSRFRLSEPYADRVQKPGTTAATPPAANGIGSKVVESHGEPRIVKRSVRDLERCFWDGIRCYGKFGCHWGWALSRENKSHER